MTVLVPAHNEEKTIVESVDSLLALDYPADRLEIVVTSDDSSDGTAALVGFPHFDRDLYNACYVLSGGELGAMVVLDVCVRLLPGPRLQRARPRHSHPEAAAWPEAHVAMLTASAARDQIVQAGPVGGGGAQRLDHDERQQNQ